MFLIFILIIGTIVEFILGYHKTVIILQLWKMKNWVATERIDLVRSRLVMEYEILSIMFKRNCVFVCVCVRVCMCVCEREKKKW